MGVNKKFFAVVDSDVQLCYLNSTIMRTILYNALTIWFQRLNPEVISAIGRGIGRVMWYCLPSRKKLATESIDYHVPDRKKPAEEMAYSSFLHSGQSFLELFMARKFDYRFMSSRVRIASPENLEYIKKVDRPIVATTGHFGAWELLAGIMRLNFNDRESQIIVKEPKDPGLNSILKHCRSYFGVQVVSKDNATFKVLRCLKRKGVSAFLVDQNTVRSKALFLPFLNDYAAINIGPALLAIRSNALIWPAFMCREPNTRYTFYSFEPLDTRDLTGSTQERVEKAALFYTQAVEDMVKKFPEQWFWMHKRWKTRPEWERRGKN